MEKGAIGRPGFTPKVRRRWRGTVIAASVAVTVVAAFTMPGSSAARQATSAHRDPAALPSITTRKGEAFLPTLGDWDGTVNGFPASFELTYDASMTQPPGTPQYGLLHVVVLRPNVCPPTPGHYAESVVDGKLSSKIGKYGSLGLSRFSFGGGFTGPRTATLSSHYNAGGCSGNLIWHMHPARRRPVDAGTWTLKFAGGESTPFTVLAGGRLATSIGLPKALTDCNGLEGAVDVFIAPNGVAKITQPSLKLTMRFSRRTASGQLNSGGGCAGGPIRFTASRNR
jgi:hypothetical protein